MKRIQIIGMAVGSMALLAVAQPAKAGSWEIDDDACGSAPGGWNAPNGAAVSSRSNGPIARLMTAIGEHFSHQMLSHGTGQYAWISHATMKTPAIWGGIGDDHVDYEDLVWGYPGPSQVNMGGAYHMLFRGSSNTEVKYTSGGSTGAAVANKMWSGIPYCFDPNTGNSPCWYGAYSEDDEYEFIYVIGRKDDGEEYRHSYGFYQYQNDKNVPNGDDMSALAWAQHCSTFVAWALNLTNGTTIASRFYNNSIVSDAAYSLHDALSDDCHDQLSWWEDLFVSCGDISDQIVNCFTAEINGHMICDDDSSSVWKGFANTGTATSVSPDRIIGNNGSGGGPWDGGVEQQVYFNQGGNVYGCFF